MYNIIPAVDCDGVIASPPLYFGHFINHGSHYFQIRAFPIRSPVGNLELVHLMHLTKL